MSAVHFIANLSVAPTKPFHAIADYGCTNHYFGADVPCEIIRPTTAAVVVGQPNGASMHSSHTGLLPFHDLPEAARTTHIFPSMQQRALISVEKLADTGFTSTFNNTSVVIKNGKTTINGERDLQEGGLYYVNLPPSKQLALAPPSNQLCYIALNTYKMTTKRDLVQYLHRYAGCPAIQAGYFATWPGLTVELLRKHLLKSLATTKGHL